MLEEALVPLEHFRQRTVEQVNDVFARQLADQILHCLYDTATERIRARMLVELPAATHLMPQGDVRQCAVEQIVDVFMLLVTKEMLATTLLRMMEQIAEVPVPPDPIEEDIKVAAHHERAQQRTVEQVVDVCVPCFLAEILVMTSERAVEQFASVRVPQVLMQKKSIMMFARPERVQQLTFVRVPDASVLEPLEEMRELAVYTQQKRTLGRNGRVWFTWCRGNNSDNAQRC